MTYRVWKDDIVVDVILMACFYGINERVRIFYCSCLSFNYLLQTISGENNVNFRACAVLHMIVAYFPKNNGLFAFTKTNLSHFIKFLLEIF